MGGGGMPPGGAAYGGAAPYGGAATPPPSRSVRIKEHHEAHALEALRRAKFKFPGRQKLFISKKWGFTKFDKEVFAEGLKTGKIVTDGVGCQYRPDHGPLARWKKQMA